MKLPTYPEYTGSDIEWLRSIPVHWKTRRLRWISKRFAGGTPDRSNESFWEAGTIPWINSGAVNQLLITEPSALITREGFANSSARWIPKGALVMALAGQGKTKGMVAQVAIETTCNQSMAAIVPQREMNTRFLFWWLTTEYDRLRNLAGGEQRDGLNLEILGSLPIPVPPLDEQRTIADFLDGETAKIDTLLAKKRALTERLREKRTALISRTVTRGLPPDAAEAAGLDPSPQLKPSGIDWLGDVPEHWDLNRLRFISPHITVGIVVEPSKYYEDAGVPCLRSLNVQPNELVDRDLVYISPESHRMLSKSMVSAGDLVAVRSGQPGTTAVVDECFDGANCIDLIIIRKPKSGSSTFFSYFLNSYPAQAQFSSGADGAIQQHFNITTAADLCLPVPPVEEQRMIANFLDRQTAKIDALNAKVETAIARLQEYRSALITAAVTGKIDVREAVA